MKPLGASRYGSGQCLCIICNTWMNHEGCHLSDGTPATESSDGWHCNCCNFKVRKKPRKTEYKAKLGPSGSLMEDLYGDDNESNDGVDLSHFSKRQANMMKKIVICMLKNVDDVETCRIGDCLVDEFSLRAIDIENEFGCSIDNLVELAHIVDPPNKMSMILEFERIKTLIGAVPTESEFEERSGFDLVSYETEFQSWSHLLERLGYDPYYRNRKDLGQVTTESDTSQAVVDYDPSQIMVSRDKTQVDIDQLGRYDTMNLDQMRTSLQHVLKDEQDILTLFNKLDRNVGYVNKNLLEKMIRQAESYMRKDL